MRLRRSEGWVVVSKLRLYTDMYSEISGIDEAGFLCWHPTDSASEGNHERHSATQELCQPPVVIMSPLADSELQTKSTALIRVTCSIPCHTMCANQFYSSLCRMLWCSLVKSSTVNVEMVYKYFVEDTTTVPVRSASASPNVRRAAKQMQLPPTRDVVDGMLDTNQRRWDSLR